MIDECFFESAVSRMKADAADGSLSDVEVSIISADGQVPGIAVAKLDNLQFLETDKSSPEDVNLGIKRKRCGASWKYQQHLELGRAQFSLHVMPLSCAPNSF